MSYTSFSLNRKSLTMIAPWKRLICVYSFHGLNWPAQTLLHWVNSLLDLLVIIITLISEIGPSRWDTVTLFQLMLLLETFLPTIGPTLRHLIKFLLKVGFLKIFASVSLKKFKKSANFNLDSSRAFLPIECRTFTVWWNSACSDSTCLCTNR